MKEITKIAAGVLLGLLVFALLWNSPAVVDRITGVLTGWDSHAQAEYQKMLDDNRETARRADEYKVRMAAACAQNPTHQNCK